MYITIIDIFKTFNIHPHPHYKKCVIRPRVSLLKKHDVARPRPRTNIQFVRSYLRLRYRAYRKQCATPSWNQENKIVWYDDRVPPPFIFFLSLYSYENYGQVSSGIKYELLFFSPPTPVTAPPLSHRVIHACILNYIYSTTNGTVAKVINVPCACVCVCVMCTGVHARTTQWVDNSRQNNGYENEVSRISQPNREIKQKRYKLVHSNPPPPAAHPPSTCEYNIYLFSGCWKWRCSIASKPSLLTILQKFPIHWKRSNNAAMIMFSVHSTQLNILRGIISKLSRLYNSTILFFFSNRNFLKNLKFVRKIKLALGVETRQGNPLFSLPHRPFKISSYSLNGSCHTLYLYTIPQKKNWEKYNGEAAGGLKRDREICTVPQN